MIHHFAAFMMDDVICTNKHYRKISFLQGGLRKFPITAAAMQNQTKNPSGMVTKGSRTKGRFCVRVSHFCKMEPTCGRIFEMECVQGCNAARLQATAAPVLPPTNSGGSVAISHNCSGSRDYGRVNIQGNNTRFTKMLT